LIDITVPQSQQTAEFLRSFRQPLLTNAYDCHAVIGHGCHANLHHGALRPFVANLSGTSAEQTGNVTFHHRTAVTTGAGQLHLIGGTLAGQACPIEQVEYLLGCGIGVDGLHGVWDADGEEIPLMQPLAHRGLVNTEVTRHGMDGQTVRRLDPFEGVLAFIHQRQDIACINGIANRCMRGKDEAGRGFRDETRFAAKLGWAITLALQDGGNGWVVSVDDFAVPKPFALDEPARLLGDVFLGAECLAECSSQVLALGIIERDGACKPRLSGLCQSHDGLSDLEQAGFRVAYQAQEHFALATTLAAKTAHDLFEVVVETLRLALQRRRLRDTLRSEVRNELEDFF
jgi:hypothetical protein